MSESDLNKDRLELALEAAGLDLWENDLITGKVPRKARKIFSELSYNEEEALNLMDDTFKIVHPEDLQRVKTAISDHLSGETDQYRCEFRLRAKHGAWVWYANYGKVMDRNSETPGRRFIGVTFNIDDRKRQEELLAIRAQEWRALTDNSPDIVARYDTDCRRIYANPTLGAMREGGIAALLGKTPTESPGGAGSTLYETKLRDVLHSGEATHFELNWKNKNGEPMCTHFRLAPERDATGNVISVLSVGRDITELSNYRAQLRETNAQLENMNAMLHTLATLDPLTQLTNRRQMLTRLQQAIAATGRSGHYAALLFIDLDRFKELNDTLGHHIGDMLLQQAAQRLKECVRANDTVARIGGDEFVVMLENLSETADEATAQTSVTANKILTLLNQPYQLENNAHHNTPSIGITLWSGQEISADELLRQADVAMYQAKKGGRNMISFYDFAERNTDAPEESGSD